MKKLTTSIIGMLCLLLSASSTWAQFSNPNVEDYGSATERYLGAPYTGEGTQLLPVGTDLWDGNDVNTIHYGQVPSNSSSKPVMVFVHGYASSAAVWFEGRDNMYRDVYRDGYRSAFVSLAPNKHVWTNGNMLANAIDKIKAHYGVNKVTVVSWSKGGVDTDAAIVHYGAHRDVAEVFTLSTPHQGTAIAEWANSILLGLVNVVFMQDNDGTRSLKRGYMNYFRSITDNNSNNTVNYTTIGGWGNGPVARLGVPQGLLYADGGSKASGGNDGVVPYKSSRRPGGLELFGGQRREYYWWGGWHHPGPGQTDLDHFEVTRGGLVWPYIKSRLGNRANRTNSEDQLAANENPNAVVRSNFQVVTSARGMRQFDISPNTQKVTVLVGQNTEGQQVRLRGNAGLVAMTPLSGERSAIDGNAMTVYELEQPEAGSYQLESDGDYVAFISSEGGIQAAFDTGLSDDKLVYTTGEPLGFKLGFENAKGVDYRTVQVSGTIQRTSDLSAQATDDEPRVLNFALEGNQYVLQSNLKLPSGIYTVTVNAKGADFGRTVITTIAVTPGENLEEDLETSNTLAIASAYPNPFMGKLNLEFDLGQSEQAELRIFNIYGQEVYQKSFDQTMGQKVAFTWEAANLSAETGIYIVQLSNGTETVTKKVLMK